MNEKNSVFKEEVEENTEKKWKLKISYLTIFPGYFENYFQMSIQSKAKEKELISTETHNIRDYAKDRKKVDDYQYGGGKGMVMKIEPIAKAIKSIKEKRNNTYFIYLNPQAKIFRQKDVQRLIEKKEIAFICGHYEGVDKRISNYVDEELSVGEFITMGGEIPALLISEALIRSVPGVIKNESLVNETFFSDNDNFDYDCYTRPSIFEGLEVPKILTSGNHKEIKKWRMNNSIKKKKQIDSNVN